ncbi:MAG: hypothetical protein ABFD96_20025 [Armatimonadia bacterium]
MGRPTEGKISVGFLVALLVAGALFFGLKPLLLRPFLRGHPDRPRPISCQSNLCQLRYAALAYATDYDGRFPRKPAPGGDWMAWDWSTVSVSDSRHPEAMHIAGPLTPYTRNYRLIACPDDPSQSSPDFANSPHSSYTWNNDLCGKLAKDVPDRPLVWDRAPFHDHGRNLISVSVKGVFWRSEKDFTALLTN